MKRVIIAVFCVVILAGSANAYGPKAYMGLYGNEARTVLAYFGIYNYFDLWVWVNPSDNGVSAIEYKLGVRYEQAIFVESSTENPDMGLTSGDPIGGEGIMISCPCQMDWFWTYTIKIMAIVDDPNIIVVLPKSLVGTEALVAGCDELKTIETLFPINFFCINTMECFMPVESHTWGAIKSLITE